MSDFRDELAALVADTAALLESLRLQGTILLPRGESLALGALPQVPSRLALAGPAAAPKAPVRPAAASIPSRAPGAHSASPPIPVLAVSARAAIPSAVPPSRAPPAAAPTTPAGDPRPMLGGWAALAEGPTERLAKVLANLGERCDGCGEAPLTGVGALRSGLVLVCDPLTSAGQNMLSNMLVRVVSVEPGDVWTANPRPCGLCASGLAQQVLSIRPNVVLAMGNDAARMVGLEERGAWGKWAGVATITAWHPAEIEAGPAPRKRAAFDVLTEVARRR